MHKRNLKGFTLIELMIVLVIIVVLTAIAYPAYMQHTAKARRVQAGGCLQSIAQTMERYRSTHNFSYTGAALTMANIPCTTDLAAFYQFPAPTVSSSTAYTLQATPINAQANDKCGTLGLNQAGLKSVSGGTVTDPQACW
ncbi:type IV pilin protein [Lysobacter claricitrinus]|uniref:type IV pilin protein n=1 Tax=Lysobacter claricitrinus TaxID=3367728 RepID=UPI0038B3701F